MTQNAVRQASKKLRQKTVLSDAQVAILRAAVALRRYRGVQRDQYRPAEVEIIATARRQAYEAGQVSLARYLILRSRQKRRAFESGSTLHDCPKCGHVHREKSRESITEAQRAEEARIIRSKMPRGSKGE